MPSEIAECSAITIAVRESEPSVIEPLNDEEFNIRVAALKRIFQRKKIVKMASPVPGVERLYVGGLHVLNQRDTLANLGVTHILSALNISTSDAKLNWKNYQHLVIDADDVEDENLLERFEETGKWIQDALESGGVVYVHCLMGMSRSVTLVIAYLLRLNRRNPTFTAAKALEGIRKSRPVACPNDGFMAQLTLYKEMGCPKDVESHPKYQRWMYMRGVELATAAGMAPDYILFEDEENGISDANLRDDVGDFNFEEQTAKRDVELRCRKCRRTLATTPYLTTHLPKVPYSSLPSSATTEPISSLPPPPTHNLCTHHFLHPLSWMRSELEQGLLNGRLECPNAKCKAQIGRYAWQGLKCSCGIWVCPAFSLQKGRVDEILKKAGDVNPGSGVGTGEGGASDTAGAIRVPPSMRKENL